MALAGVLRVEGRPGQERRPKRRLPKSLSLLNRNNIDLKEAYEDHNVACELQEKAKVKRGGGAWRIVGDVGH